MDNISLLLSETLKKIFFDLDYVKNLSDSNKSQLICINWNVIYVKIRNIDYLFKNLKLIMNLFGIFNLKISLDNLVKDLNSNSDINNFEIVLEKNNLGIVLKKKCIINFIKKSFLLDNLLNKEKNPKKILVDFSSPNIAKDMHVGHLRSTIIGDSISRLFEELGHDVQRINHVGDFGLNFGMLIHYLKTNFPNHIDSNFNISDLQKFYTEAKKNFDIDDDFKKKSYQMVVSLQNGEKGIIEPWEYIKDVSRKSYNEIYRRLNIKLKEVAESFYQKIIPDLILELKVKNLIFEDCGRFIFKIDKLPEILTIIKSDGSSTYDTTDVAAIKYRSVDLNMDQIYYVVDVGQSNHFKLIFEIAKLAGWINNEKIVKHIEFGLVLNQTGGKFKTRENNTIKLIDILNEAINIAEQTYLNKENTRSFIINLNEIDKKNVIEKIAYNSIKYSDLSSSRTNNYYFFNKNMLSLKGNTAPYLMYAYVRICGIIKNCQESINEILNWIENFEIFEEIEFDLAKNLLQFPEILNKLKDDLYFHILCNYTYNLCTTFHSFFNKCRIINIESDKVSTKTINFNRLILCILTKRILDKCFYILGLEPVEKM
ncbi:Arginyl-tRNA synthetase [uncultured virus]|nr:Arginyl-tRNA synthetase [uncultured virus]